MGLPERRYTEDQKQAMATAVVDLGLTGKDVAARAAAGTLEHYGAALDPFEVPATSVATYARRLREGRKRAAAQDVTEKPHRDQIEELRRTLVKAAAETLAAWERQKPADRDVERGRQIARLIREAAAIPARTDPTPPAPGAKVEGKREGAETKGGIAGKLLADHRATTGPAQAEPATPPPTHPKDSGSTETTPPTPHTPQHPNTHNPTNSATSKPPNHHHNDQQPGSAVRALAEQLGHALPTTPAGAG